MYFLLAAVVDRFVFLKLGLSVILIFIGIKLLLLEVYKIPTLVSLGVVLGILTVSVVAALSIFEKTFSTHRTSSSSGSRSLGMTASIASRSALRFS